MKGMKSGKSKRSGKGARAMKSAGAAAGKVGPIRTLFSGRVMSGKR